MTKPEMLEYLKTNVYMDGKCRVWAGSMNGNVPSVGWRRKQHQVRRLLLALKGVKLSHKHCVIAECDNPDKCVEYRHLKVVGRREVYKLSEKHSPMLTPESRARIKLVERSKAGTSKIPLSEMNNVLQMLVEGKSYREISAHYGLRNSYPYFVRNKLKSWKRAGLLPFGVIIEDEQENRSRRTKKAVVPEHEAEGGVNAVPSLRFGEGQGQLRREAKDGRSTPGS